jgi:hypothetical protein
MTKKKRKSQKNKTGRISVEQYVQQTRGEMISRGMKKRGGDEK